MHLLCPNYSTPITSQNIKTKVKRLGQKRQDKDNKQIWNIKSKNKISKHWIQLINKDKHDMAYRSILQMEVSDHIKSFPSFLLFKDVPTSDSTNNSHKNIIKILYDFDQKHTRLVHGVPYLYKKLISIFPTIKEYHSFTYNKLSWVC